MFAQKREPCKRQGIRNYGIQHLKKKASPYFTTSHANEGQRDSFGHLHQNAQDDCIYRTLIRKDDIYIVLHYSSYGAVLMEGSAGFGLHPGTHMTTGSTSLLVGSLVLRPCRERHAGPLHH